MQCVATVWVWRAQDALLYKLTRCGSKLSWRRSKIRLWRVLVLSLSSSNRDTRNRILRRGSPRRCHSRCCSTHLREGVTALPRSVPVVVVVVVATSVAVPGRQHYNAAKGSPSVTRLRYPARLPTHALRRFVRILRRRT